MTLTPVSHATLTFLFTHYFINCYLLFIGKDKVAQQMKEKIRVLCWIMTSPDNHQKKAIHVKRTWGKRCNVLLFMSSKEGNLQQMNNSFYFKEKFDLIFILTWNR